MPSAAVKSRLTKKSTIITPSGSSKTLRECLMPLLPDNKEQTVDESKILPDLLRQIFTGDEISIKDNYACLVAYLAMNSKEVSYDRFVGSYESVKMGCEPLHGVCSALPYGALITSGIIFKWTPEQINLTIFKLLKIDQNEPEITSIIFHFLIALINNLKSVKTHRLNKVKVNSLIQLYFLLCVDCKRDESSLENPLFDADNISSLTEVFLQESEDHELLKKVSILLAKKLLTLPDEAVSKFWKTIMNAYSKQRTNYKELAVLHLLAGLLEYYDQSEFPIQQLFTPSVIKMLSKASPKIEPIFKCINAALKKLSSKLSGETKLAIIHLIIGNTEKYLGKIFAVKICDTLTASMNFEEISTVVESHKQVIMGEKHKTKLAIKHINNDFTEFEKIYAVRYMGKLVGHNSCKHEARWRKDQLKFLFKIGFLSEYKVTIPPHLAGISRKIFFTCLNQKFPKLADLEMVLRKLIKFASEKMADAEENFIVPVREKAVNLWVKTKGIVKGLDENEEDGLVFKVLFQYMMLLIFSSYPLAKNSLEELFKVIENKELSSGEFHWSEVTVDLFLQLLSGDNNTHRNVINSTFGHVCKHLTAKGLELILSAVSGREDGDDDEMEPDDSAEEEEEGSSDASASDDGNSSDGDGDVHESDMDSDEENEGQIDKLKDALRQQLYKIDTASTCGSVDLDDLDPDEGKQLNTTLGQIFKEQHGRYKSSAKNKVDNLEIHFRIRVLDLLEIYIENKPSLYSSIVILTNSISLLKTSTPNYTLAPFTVSLMKCLKKLTSLKEFADCDCVTETSLCSTLNHVLDKDCPASVYQDLTEQIIDSSLFLIRASFQLKETGEEINDFLKNTMKAFFTDVKSHIPFDLLTSLFSSLSLSKLIGLTSNIVDFAFSKKIKYHKKTQALQLLITFYNNNRLFKDVRGFEDPLNNIQVKILKKSLKFIKKVSQNTDITKKYGCMFLDLLCLIKNKNNVFGACWDNATEIINGVSEVPFFQNEVRVSFVKFCKIFNYELPKKENKSETSPKSVRKGKRKSSEIIHVNGTGSPKKSKKNKKKSKKNL